MQRIIYIWFQLYKIICLYGVISVGLFKKTEAKAYDKANKIPVIKSSICTGEQVAGFRDIHTGKIEEIMLIKAPMDIEKFRKMYKIDGEITKVY